MDDNLQDIPSMKPQGGIGYTRYHDFYWRPEKITVNGEKIEVYNLAEYGHGGWGCPGWHVYAEVGGTRIWRQNFDYGWGPFEFKEEHWTDEQRREAGLEGQ